MEHESGAHYPLVSTSDLDKIDVRVGTILAAEDVAHSEKLVWLRADFGDHARSICHSAWGRDADRRHKCLAERRAAPKCQFDAFAGYVAAAEEHGAENYPLYQWTKATIENPAKKEKYLKSLTLYVDDREVYAKEIADALEADLQALAISGLITRISKYDTNPANNPHSPLRPRERR